MPVAPENVAAARRLRDNGGSILGALFIALLFHTHYYVPTVEAWISNNERVQAHQYVFTKVGEMAVGLGYGHLVVPVNYTTVEGYVNKIKETIDDANRKFGSGNGFEVDMLKSVMEGHYSTLKYELSQLESITTSDDIKEILDRIKREAPLYQNNPDMIMDILDEIVKRDKRQVMIGIFGALLGALGASVVNGYLDQADYNNLVKGINGVDKKTDVLFHTCQSLTSGQDNLRRDINYLNNANQAMLKMINGNRIAGRYLSTVIACNGLVIHAQMEIDAAYSGYMTVINNQRLSPRIVDFNHLKVSFQELKTQMQTKGYGTFFDDPKALFQLPASYIPMHQGFGVAVHVPMTSLETVLTLWKWQGMPLFVDGLVIEIRPAKRFIAVDKDQDYYVEVDPDDLAACKLLGRNYMCPQLQVLNGKDNPSCLFSLLQNDAEGAQKNCEIHLMDNKQYATALKDDTFWTFSNSSTRVEILCNNGSTTHENLFQFNKIRIDPGCVGTTSQLKLIASGIRTTVTGMYKHSTWDVDTLVLLGGLNTSEYKTIMAGLKRIGKSPTNIKDLQAHQKEYLELDAQTKADIAAANGVHTSSYTREILFYVVLILIGLAVVWVTWQCCRNGRQQYRNARLTLENLLNWNNPNPAPRNLDEEVNLRLRMRALEERLAQQEAELQDRARRQQRDKEEADQRRRAFAERYHDLREKAQSQGREHPDMEEAMELLTMPPPPK